MLVVQLGDESRTIVAFRARRHQMRHPFSPNHFTQVYHTMLSESKTQLGFLAFQNEQRRVVDGQRKFVGVNSYHNDLWMPGRFA